MGRRGSKINISGIKMHHFFVPELMAYVLFVGNIFGPIIESYLQTFAASIIDCK